MSRVIDRCIAIGVTTLLSTCLLPDAVWQEQSVTDESLGAAGASSSVPGAGSNAGTPADTFAEPDATPRREGTGGGTPLVPPASGAAGDLPVGVTDAGASCSTGADCTSAVCSDGVCQVATCGDGVHNQDESGVDCGGNDPDCARCAVGVECSVTSDCISGSCLDGQCIDCSNAVQDGLETGPDCGGRCGPCGPGQTCLASSDCTSGLCQDGRCCGGTEVDCTRCARNLVSTLSCDTQGPAAQPTCDAFLQCLSDNPSACAHRSDETCSAPGGACDVAQYGGDGSAGIALADAVLGTAGCSF
jgi:hypothetical protein